MPNPIQRLRYFDHQLLGVPEFADEQQYHMDMRRLHNRLLHTWGIADGLEVHYSAANQRLTVEEGTALDAAGREIVLQQQRDLDLAAFDGQTVWVTLAYGEVQTAPVTDGQATDYGRWEEAPRLELSATRPADSGQQLVLGRVHVNAAGESRVDDGEGSYRRRQAGSKAGDIEVRAITLSGSSDPEGWPSLRMTEAKAAALSGALTVEGALAATGDLDVQGNATVAQSVGIGGKPQARLHVQTPPQEAGANAVLVGPAEGTSLRLGYNVGYGWIQSRDGGLRVNDQGGDVLLVPGAGGSVGIGTTQPLQRLHVVGDDAVGLFESRGSAASLSLGTREGEANRAGIAARPGGRLALWTQAGDDVVNVTRDGRVGMGTENPTHRFHVRADDPVALFESIGAQAYLRIATREGMESRVEVANRPGGRLALWTAGGGDALSITREGSVGIGTDHPGARLHVAGDLVVDGVIRSAAGTTVGGGGGGAQWGGAGPWQPVNAGLGFAGSVGIGTLTPEARLQVIDSPQGSGGNTLILGPTGGSNLRLGYNTEYSWIQSHGSKPLRINELGNDVVIAAGANANVGIGTGAPKSRLHVVGDLLVEGIIRTPQGPLTAGGGGGGTGAAPVAPLRLVAPDAPLHIEAPGDGVRMIFTQQNGQSNWDMGIGGGRTPGARDFWLGDGRAVHWSVTDGTGNMGVGTNAPKSKLHVVGDLLVEGTIRTPQGAIGAIAGGAPPVATGSSAGWTDTANGGIARTHGNVGIGTAEPSHALHVRADGAVGLFESSSNNAFLRVSTSDGIDNRVELCNRGGGRLALWVAGAGDALNILKTGRVGIGTPTPQAPLHVVGDLLVEGTIRTPQGPLTAGGGGGGTGTAPVAPLRLVAPDAPLHIEAPGDGVRMIFTQQNGQSNWDMGIGGGRTPGARDFWLGDGRAVHWSVTDGTGNMGVGTSAPKSKLHVVGDLLVEGNIRTPKGDVVPGGTAGGTSPWGSVAGGISYKGGRVGIGTDKLSQQLNVTEGIGFANQNADDKRLWSPADGLLRWQTHNAAGQHAFEVGHQGDAAAVHLDTNGPSWLTGGMLGVGTAKPSHVFHARADGAVGLFESSSNNAFLRVATSDGIDNRVELCNRGGGRLALWVAGGSDALNIVRDGRVGINTVAPEARLQIVNGPQDSNGNTLILGPTNAPNLRLGYAADYSWIQSHASKPLRINELGNDVVINRGGGRTGIGIDPQARLHVNGQITAGPFAWSEAVGRVEATGPAGELSFARRDLAAPRANAGDRYVWYNQDGTARLWTEGVGNIISIDAGGTMEVANLRIRSGSKPGFVYDHFVNETGDDVEQGDVVVIGESDVTRFWATGNTIPIPEVDLCDRAYDTRVCGIVDSVTRAGELPFAEAAETTGRRRKKAAADDAAHPLQGLAADDEAAPATVGEGQLGRMVTLGAYAYCKVDADLAPIQAGDLLTTSPTKGHAQKVLDRGQAGGAIIGKALASLATGKGKIPVMVLMQ